MANRMPLGVKEMDLFFRKRHADLIAWSQIRLAPAPDCDLALRDGIDNEVRICAKILANVDHAVQFPRASLSQADVLGPNA